MKGYYFFMNIMIYIRNIVFVLSLFQISYITQAQEVKNSHSDSLNTIVSSYYEINFKIFQLNSTVEDIDEVFELFTDDFTYVHPKYGGVYTRQILYDGYVRNQKNNGYDGSITDIKIINKIVGLNSVVVQRSYVEKVDGKTVVGPPQMTLFEFKSGKISRIFEYW